MPARYIFPGDALQSRANQSPQDVFRGCALIKYVSDGLKLDSSHRLLQYLGY